MNEKISVFDHKMVFLGEVTPEGLLALCQSGRFNHLHVRDMPTVSGETVDGLYAVESIVAELDNAIFTCLA